MALALCHVIPRDNLMRFCVVLLVAAFILQAVAIARRVRDDSAGTFSVASGQDIRIGADITITRADGVGLCHSAQNPISCVTYLSRMRAVVGLVLAAFISTPIAVAIIMAGIVQLSRTTQAMVIGFWVSIVFPFLATLVATGVFFNHTVDRAAASLGVPSSSFSRGISTNLVVASCAVHCFAFVLATIRLIIALVLRPAMKAEMIQSKNIESVMTLHMVNDDWDRQKKVWAGHAKTVTLALAEDGGRAPESSTRFSASPSHEPNHEGDAASSLDQTSRSVVIEAGAGEPVSTA